MKNWIYFLAAALLLSTVGLAAECMRLESEADVAEAHAQAADERAGSCEAKFDYSTVIVEPARYTTGAAAASAPGVNFYHGLFRISVNAPAPAAEQAPQQAMPLPTYVIPAKITPQNIGMEVGSTYYWVNNKTHEQRGPYSIPIQGTMR